MTLALRYQAHSEIGLVRKNNQDSAYVSPTMLAVADGMGGAAAGDLASAVAVSALTAVDGEYVGEEMLTAFATAIEKAAEQIRDLVESDPALDGMGSTVCGVMFDGTHLGVANIGDSRAYRYREGRLQRITRDHSWVQTLVDEGRITEAEALEHPHRSFILRVINGAPQHQPDLELAPVESGDRLLICSDGLCGMATDAEIAQMMDGEIAEVMPRLIALAHAAGGQDNITIILADIVEGERVGPTEVLGAATTIDLATPVDPHTIRIALPATEEARPDPDASERERYSPTTKGRGWAWLKVSLALLVPLLLLGVGGGLWFSYTQQQFYVGANAGAVAIFRGVPDQVVGLELSQLVESVDTSIDDLPPYYREQVLATLPATSLEGAREVVSTLQGKAEECVAQREARATQTAAPPSPSVSPSSSSTPSGSPAASVTPGATPGTTSPSVPSPTTSLTPPAPEGC